MNDYAVWTALTKKKKQSSGLKKKFFGPLKIREEPGPPGPLPWIRYCEVPTRENELILSWY